MGNRAVRSLVFACSLLLALPQGWCCLFACPQAKATVATTADTQDTPEDAGDSCPCCPHKPPAPTKSTCCCSDRHATVPTTASVEPPDDGFVLLPPPNVAAQTVAYSTAVVGTDLPPPTGTLHILHCVWLC
jgi:hypothetical protein